MNIKLAMKYQEILTYNPNGIVNNLPEYYTFLYNVSDYNFLACNLINITNLIMKTCILNGIVSSEEVKKSYFYSEINDKSYARCIFLAFSLPVLNNVVIAIYDFATMNWSDEEYVKDQATQNPRNILNAPWQIRQNKYFIQQLMGYSKSYVIPKQESINQFNSVAISLFNPMILFNPDAFAKQINELNQGIYVDSEYRYGALAFKYIDDDLKNDYEIVKEASYQKPEILKYAHIDAVKEVLKYYGEKYEHVSVEHSKDVELFKIALENYQYAFQFAHDDIKSDRELALLAINRNYCNFKHASKTLKENREFVIEAVKISWEVYYDLSDEFKNDPEIKQLANTAN